MGRSVIGMVAGTLYIYLAKFDLNTRKAYDSALIDMSYVGVRLDLPTNFSPSKIGGVVNDNGNGYVATTTRVFALITNTVGLARETFFL